MGAGPSIRLFRFSKSDQRLYHAYLQLKYEVFVAEQGWHQLAGDSPAMAREDEFDIQGRFWLAATEEMVPLGIVRGTPLKEGFPRRELLEHHLQHPDVAGLFAALCTINGLAVRAEHRRNSCQVPERGWTGAIGKLLLLAMVRDLEVEGMQAAIATAGDRISVRLCESIGFLPIDQPQRTWLHPGLTMTNIGMVFGSPQHIRAQRECGMGDASEIQPGAKAERLFAYFEQRSATLLGSGPVAKDPLTEPRAQQEYPRP